jgi:hypothetical protein
VHSEIDPTDEQLNPIYRYLIDFGVVEEIMSRVGAVADPRIKTESADVMSSYQRIKARCIGPSSSKEQKEDSAPLFDWKQLSREELVALSQEVCDDICQFVQLTMTFYAALKSYRPLTHEEREQGKKLTNLLVALQKFIPTTKNGTVTDDRREDAAAR